MEGLRQNGFDRSNRIPSRIHLLEKDGLKNSATSSVQEMNTTTIREMTMQNIRNKIQQMQSNLVEEVDVKLTELVSKVLQEVKLSDITEEHRYVLVDDGSKYKNRRKPGEDGPSEKQFMARNSLLTDLFEKKHIQTIYNIFIVILIILFMNTLVYDLVVIGKLNLGLHIIRWNFQGFDAVFYLWLEMSATTMLLFSCFNFWANQRIKYLPNTFERKCWDYGWLCTFITYEILFLCLPAMKIMENFVPPALSMALLLEQVRLMMKTYAFVRSNTPRALAYKPHQSGDKKETSPCPGFSKYLYFLFAPTLLYRDNYPQTKEVRWKFVVWCFVEVIGAIFCIEFVFERLLIPIYRNYGLPEHQNIPVSESLVVGMFGSMMPSTLIFLCGFYLLLHSWMNAFAEMLKFADRMFYKDWWNASSHGTFYRFWNIIVHDWLYTYIYKDMSEILKPGKRWVSTLTVFIVSAVFHEYVLTLTFGNFYPVLFVSFAGFGVGLVFLTKDLMPGGNIIVWLAVSGGMGIVFCLYGYESYARVNCPQILDPFWDFFVPRSWTCKSS